MDGFVHLHVHSHFSLLDGACRYGDLVNTTKEHGSNAIALTDHGNLFGAVDFFTTAKSAGIKPIMGLEAYISPTHRTDKSMGQQRTAAYHLLLLAMNLKGWDNLRKLTSRSFLEGFYYKPRVDRELLSEFNEGLICTTACLGGEVPQAVLQGDMDKALRIAGEYKDIFGPERFFIEIQKQGIEDQDKANPHLVEIAKKLGVGIVGTNDVHFMHRADKPAHEVLTCISTGKTLADGGALHYPPELYLKSPAEMREALKDFPEACDNTLKIAEMCNCDLDFTAKYLPVFETPDDSTPEDFLRKIAWEGLTDRFKDKGINEIPEDYNKRLERELDVIQDKGYSSYFLIVNDFVQFARRNSIPAGPRGSGVATLLGYALGIADVDPMRYGLLFERFTDPQRQEDPDIDIDICQEGRAKVLQFVREKYGYVAQIITHGTLKAKAVVRDVGRALDVPLPEVNAICKLVPEGPKVTLQKAIDGEPDLNMLYKSDNHCKQIIDYGKPLEGLARHTGVHACGVIVAQIPLDEVVPLYCQASDPDEVITQWDGPTCEKAGLMKMDFLGLRTLTILQRTRELVHQRTGKDIDPEKIPMDDQQVYELFRNGHTDGVFQFESDGMKNVLRQMLPERIEGLIAANAMYRPGPMELIPAYCARKNGTEEVPSLHELVDDILEETYGIMAYQEQVMQVLNRLGKLPLNRALTLIKAISKKKEKVIMSERSNFIDGAKENGISEEKSNELFELILKFAGYGFNKAHSTRYAIVAYQTAYFKRYHPSEFMAATLTYEAGDTEKVVQYMTEANRMNVTIAPPDINKCDSDFSVDGESVRFGLSGVKGVGTKAVDAIIEARKEVGEFTDLYHFCENIDLKAVNRSTIEALIKCGAFDSMGAHRAAMIAAIDAAIDLGQAAARDKKSGQMSFFDAFGASDPVAAKPQFPNIEPWSDTQLLQAEKETLGFYITSHPLVQYARELSGLTTPKGFTLSKAETFPDKQAVMVGCMIAGVRPVITKKGTKMAMVTLEDTSGKCDAVIFPRTYDEYQEYLQVEKIVVVYGAIEYRNERPQIVINEIYPIDDAIAELTGELRLIIPSGKESVKILDQIKELIPAYKGNVPLSFETTVHNRSDITAVIQADKSWWVSPSRELLDKCTEILGSQDKFQLTARKKQPMITGGNRRQFKSRGMDKSKPVSAAVTRFN